MKHSQATESKGKKGKKVIEPIKVPRTKEGLAEVVKEVLARPAEVNGIWWQRHTFKAVDLWCIPKS
jgi:predicted CoA-binding protein